MSFWVSFGIRAAVFLIVSSALWGAWELRNWRYSAQAWAAAAGLALAGYIIFGRPQIALDPPWMAGVVAVALLPTFGLSLLWLWVLGAPPSTKTGPDAVVRGTRIFNEESLARGTSREPATTAIGTVRVPSEIETRSFLLLGAPGTGKSLAIGRMLDDFRAVDGSRAIIADASGIYVSRYYDDRRDRILNPHDARSARWSPLAEIKSVADVPALAKSFVPDGEGESKAWNNYAQGFIEQILEHCFVEGLRNRDFLRLCTSAPTDELVPIFAGSPVAALLERGADRTLASVRAIVGSHVRAIRYLDPEAGARDFSIRDFMQESAGWLFLSYEQGHRDGLAPLIAAALDVAARATLGLPPDLSRRVIFALDELPLLGKVQSIVDLATNGRKHGAVLLAGIQTVSQLRESYGRETAQTLLACFGNALILRCSDAETAEYASRHVGDAERIRTLKSGGSSSGDSSSSHDNWTQQYSKDRAVLPSEIQSLADRVGILRLVGYHPGYVSLPFLPERKAGEAFVPKGQPPRPAAAKVLPVAQQQAQAQQAQPQKVVEDGDPWLF